MTGEIVPTGERAPTRVTSHDWTSDALDASKEPWDLVVIGGGTAGIVAAKTAARAGADVVLIERGRPGGGCLWTGCVPSKTLLSAAHGVAGRGGLADLSDVMQRVRDAIVEIEPLDSPDAMRAEGVTMVHGPARFLGPRAIDVDGRQLTFRAAIIATGSAPTMLDLDALAGATVVTSDSVWDLDQLPARLLVIGGGAIGCELGQAFSRLGSAVTIAEAGPRLLPQEPPDAAAVVADVLVADGITVLTDAAVDRDLVSAADVVLVAVGRTSRIGDLDLAEADVEVTDRGHVAVDDRLCTSNRRIWAAGDVTGHPPFTHVAGVHGALAATNAVLGLRRKIDLSAVPHVVFTQPEIAAVGKDRAADASQRERTVQHAEVDRAVAESEPAGFSRLVLNRRSKVVGGCIVGPRAGESLAEVTLAVQHGLKARHIAAAIHPYPTYGDGIWNAARAQVREDLTKPWLQRITSLLLRWRRRRR